MLDVNVASLFVQLGPRPAREPLGTLGSTSDLSVGGAKGIDMLPTAIMLCWATWKT